MKRITIFALACALLTAPALAALPGATAITPLDAIRRWFLETQSDKTVHVISMQQAGDTIIASAGQDDWGMTLVLKEYSPGNWVVITGEGGAIPANKAQNYGLTGDDVANFLPAHPMGLVATPGFAPMVSSNARKKVTTLIVPSQHVTLHPSQDLKARHIPPQ
jgi:hypothetical protein